jgi:hypothetical protein
MTTQGMEVLLVGPEYNGKQVLPCWLGKLGFQCHIANSIRAAIEVLDKTQVDLVLCMIRLPDGSGFSLVMPLEGLPITAFLCLSVEEGCVWVAAIDHGRYCLGKAAYFSNEFTGVLEQFAQSLPMPPSMGLLLSQSSVA